MSMVAQNRFLSGRVGISFLLPDRDGELRRHLDCGRGSLSDGGPYTDCLVPTYFHEGTCVHAALAGKAVGCHAAD